MEAFTDCNFTTQQLQQLNACQMYLQVTMLAEIMDHTGTHLFPQVLLQHNKHSLEGLNQLSESTLTWPVVHNPSTACWRLWTRTVRKSFMGSEQSQKLTQPLGDWMTDYQQCWFWKWQFLANGHLLHQSDPDARPHAALPTKQTCWQIMFSVTIPTNQCFARPPITPHYNHNQHIDLPIKDLAPPPAPSTEIHYATSLIQQFRTTLLPWQKPLFSPIQKLQPTYTIRDLCK